MKRSKTRRKDVLIKYKLTKEPSLNMNDRLSAGALAHHKSNSSTNENTKRRAICKSASSVPNEKVRKEPLARVLAQYQMKKQKRRVTQRV